MNISDFARARNVEPQTVSRYIKRHPEIEKLTIKNGKKVELTAEAEELLDEIYPLPRPVEIVQGVPEKEHRELLNKYAQAQEIIIKLQEERVLQAEKLAKLEATQALLEDKEKQLALQSELREKAEKRADNAEERVQSAEERAQSAEEHANKLLTRGLIARILNEDTV